MQGMEVEGKAAPLAATKEQSKNNNQVLKINTVEGTVIQSSMILLSFRMNEPIYYLFLLLEVV